MLHLQSLELLLDLTQALQLGNGCWFERWGLANQFAVAHLLAPLREHERGMHSDSATSLINTPGWLLICTALSLKATPYRLIFCGPGIPIDHSFIRSECQRNRYKLHVWLTDWLGRTTFRRASLLGATWPVLPKYEVDLFQRCELVMGWHESVKFADTQRTFR